MRCGDKVVVKKAMDESSRELLGAVLVFQRTSKPHGFAVCTLDSRETWRIREESRRGKGFSEWFIHPECLEVIP